VNCCYRIKNTGFMFRHAGCSTLGFGLSSRNDRQRNN
jgi:hypothetical protein